jgi:fatty acid desaturase
MHTVRTSRWLPLRCPADRRTLTFLVIFNALLVIQWLGIVRHWLLMAVTCVFAVIALVVKHNHVHCRTFRSARWNSCFELWLSIMSGHPTTGIVTSHNVLHHGHNNTDRDFVRCSLVGSRRNWLNLATFFFQSVSEMFCNKPNDLDAWRHCKPSLYRQAVLERICVYATMAGLLLLHWRATLLYCMVPWLFAQWVLVSINLLQHQDCDFASEFDHSRNVTGKWANYMLLNNGFHTAHHLFPAKHWSLLPQVHEQFVAPHIDPRLNERSLWASVWKRFVLGQRSAIAAS